MYQNYCPCYLHIYMACFLTNCLQNARNEASDNPFFQNFLGNISRRRRSYAPLPPCKILAKGLGWLHTLNNLVIICFFFTATLPKKLLNTKIALPQLSTLRSLFEGLNLQRRTVFCCLRKECQVHAIISNCKKSFSVFRTFLSIAVLSRVVG